MTEQKEQNILNIDEIAYEEISDPAVMAKEPVVSVFMITYNHEAFIAQAIEGVLIQETDFPIELVIGEDCSTDRTREIVLDYQKKYPDLIRVVISEKNVGAKKNGARVGKLLRGKYVAVCEGDDYWNDPLKLQKQVSLLERNPDCSGCFTDCFVIEESKPKRIVKQSVKKGNRYTLFDIAKKMPCAMCHWVFPKSIWDNRPDWFDNLKIGAHTALLTFAAEQGDCLHIPEPTATYRVHSGGVTSGADPIILNESALYNLLLMRQHLSSKSREYLRYKTAGRYLSLSVVYTKSEKLSEAIRAIKEGLRMNAISIIKRKGFYLLLLRICIITIRRVLKG